MALYRKVLGQLVLINGAMDDALKSCRDLIKKGYTKSEAVRKATTDYGLTSYEQDELMNKLQSMYNDEDLRLGTPRDDNERRERHMEKYGNIDLPPRGTGKEMESSDEKRYVYGTRDSKWHLVGQEDRDYKDGISQEEFRRIGSEKAKSKYLGR